jgi:hypothetical protein
MTEYRGTFVGELTKQQYDIIDDAEKPEAVSERRLVDVRSVAIRKNWR